MGRCEAVDKIMINVKNMASKGNVIFLFLNLNFILFEISLNPRIIKYATGGAINTKYLLSLIAKTLWNIKNVINQHKNNRLISIYSNLIFFVMS